MDSEMMSAHSIDSGFDTNSRMSGNHYATRSHHRVSDPNNVDKINDKPANAKTTKANKNPKVNRNTKKKLPNVDKENDAQIANNLYLEHGVASKSSQFQKLPAQSSAFRNCANSEELDESMEISQCDTNDSPIDILRWLQPRRDVGLYVQCTQKKCGKWRFTNDHHDPVDVPEKWVCSMNSDLSLASCSVPQKAIPAAVEDDMIENKYNAGSIVWARVNGYPWWPAMIDDCPEKLQYYKLRNKSNVPHEYHVSFFDEEDIIERAWLINRNLKPFLKNPRDTVVKKTVFKKIDYKPRLDKACKVAESAILLPIYQRLKTYSYIERLTRINEKQNCSQHNENQQQDCRDDLEHHKIAETFTDKLQVRDNKSSSSLSYILNSQSQKITINYQKLSNANTQLQSNEALVVSSQSDSQEIQLYGPQGTSLKEDFEEDINDEFVNYLLSTDFELI